MKYKNTSVRTGFKIGEIVELSKEEFSNIPFNSKLTLVTEIVEEEDKPKKKVKRRR